MRGLAMSFRRAVLLAFATSLSFAAAVAIVAVLSHHFDALDGRLVATSLGFSLFSALGAAGVSARPGRAPVRQLGTATVAGAGASFALCLTALWIDAGEAIQRAGLTVFLVTLALSHACVVLTARRDADSPLVSRLTLTSVGTGTLDAALLVAAVNGVVGVDDTGVRLLIVLNIVFLLTSVLPPILRRATRREATASRSQRSNALGVSDRVASPGELLSIAQRLEALAPMSGDIASPMRTVAAHLRQTAERPTF